MDFDVNVWLDLTEKPVKLILMNVAQILVNMKEPLQFLQIVAWQEQGVGVVYTDPGDVLIQLLLPLQPTLTVSRLSISMSWFCRGSLMQVWHAINTQLKSIQSQF